MATYTPEQIREYTKGMSDKQIADAAQQFGVSAGELATAFNTTEDVIKQRASAAGADLTVSSKPVTPPRPAPAPTMNVADTSSPVTSGSSTGDTVGQTVTGGTGTGTPIAPVSGAMTPGAGVTPEVSFAVPTPGMMTPEYQMSQEMIDAGGLQPYLAQQYAAGNIDAVNKVIADSGMTAQQIATQFNMTQGDLNYLASQGVVAPGLPQVPSAPAEAPTAPVAPEVEQAEAQTALSTAQQDIYNKYVAAMESGDYSDVQQALVNNGYTLDDVKNIFNLSDADMETIKATGITGADPQESAMSTLYAEIQDLLSKNQDATAKIAELNNYITTLGLTMSDLQSRYNLTPEGLSYLDAIGIGPTPDATVQALSQRAEDPTKLGAMPEGAQMTPAKIGEATSEQLIGAQTGQIGQMAPVDVTTSGMVSQAATPTVAQPQAIQAATATGQVEQAMLGVQPAQGQLSQQAQVNAAQMSPTATEVGTLGAAQLAQAQQVQAPQSRTLQQGEIVESVANAQQAAAFAEQVQAATADPSARATVQGQLADLMSQFEGGETPAWAAGAMRNANAVLAARGLGASSMAGQAIIQAAMESALPIAQADAQTVAQFELTNLSNRQARAMLAAQQRAQFIGQEFDQEFQARVANASRISDIANLNFNAEQQIALENAQLAQTVDLANLSNNQALVMAEAAQIAQLETTNLNNRQQAAVQNAQAFLQMDLTNLSNQQQTDMFKAQSTVQSLLSDQAAENATRQFNASSQQQADQFFANMSSQINQFNATQNNAMAQFNAEQSNVMAKFNAELQNQRDQFNAQNQLVIEQSNAQWRREISTADTAAQNLANQFNAQAILDISNTAYAQLWQAYRDDMEWAWTSGENERDRLAEVTIQQMKNTASQYSADAAESSGFASAAGTFAAAVVSKWG